MIENNNIIKRVQDMGEFAFINHITKGFKPVNNETKYAIGDDAAVAEYEDQLVITTDLLTEGIHFNLIYTPLKHLGYKAVVVNLSDVCAMNAQPCQILVSLAVSNKLSVNAIEELYEGIKLACKKYNVDLIGGDTTASLTGLTISITAIGKAKKENIVYRNGAQINDLICVTGDLGGAYMGLQLLEREKKIFETNSAAQPALDGYEYILERQLKPEARFDIIEKLEKAGIIPTSMIDISDGLSSELMHICTQSKTGCSIYEEKIPINENTAAMANELNIEPLISALNGGEDYELLFTLPVGMFDKIKSIADISVIGHITDKGQGLNIITKDNRNIPLKAQGWDSFKD